MILNDSSLVRKILDLACLFSKIYPTTAVALVGLLAYMAFAQLQIVHQRLKSMGTSASLSVEQLKIFRRQYFLTCKIVERINQAFGWIILLEVCFIVVGVVNNYMFIMVSVLYTDWRSAVLTSTICFYQVFHLLLITSVSDLILNEVRKEQTYGLQSHPNFTFACTITE